jgi:hypothetical protein
MADISRARTAGRGLGGVASQLLRHMIGNRCHTAVTLAMHSSNKENLKTAAAGILSVNGKFYTTAIATEIDVSALAFLSETGATVSNVVVAASKKCVFLVIGSAASTPIHKIVQGVVVDNVAGTAAKTPGCPPDHAAFGAVLVQNSAAGSAFTFGTSLLDAAGITATYFDLATVPSGDMTP